MIIGKLFIPTCQPPDKKEESMEVQLLREQEIFPPRKVLQDVLDKVYDVWAELETLVRSKIQIVH